MDQLHWAIVGPGNIASDFIGDLALVKGGPNTVVGVMSNRIEEAEAFARQHDIPGRFDDLEDMLQSTRPDVVYIAAPHSVHFPAAMTCIQQGCAVLCEKPLGINSEEVIRLIQAAQEKEVFLLEGMWIRFLPSLFRLRALVKSNAIGPIEHLIADMSYVAPNDRHNRFYDPRLGGGSLLDLGLYPVYLSLLVFGKPTAIVATARLTDQKVDEDCSLLFQYSKKRFAILESSIVRETSRTATLYGRKAKLTLLKPWNEKPGALVLSPYEGACRQIPCFWPGRGFQYEIEEVIRCLNAGRIESSLHSHAVSLALASLLDRIRKKTGIQYPADNKKRLLG